MSECERQVTLFYGISRCSLERGAQNVDDVTIENDLISGLRSLEPPHPPATVVRPTDPRSVCLLMCGSWKAVFYSILFCVKLFFRDAGGAGSIVPGEVCRVV